MLRLTPPKYHRDAKSDALWFATDPGQSSGRQTFDTLYDAVEFVTMRLEPTKTTLVEIYPERGEPLQGVPQINDAWTAVGPPIEPVQRRGLTRSGLH